MREAIRYMTVAAFAREFGYNEQTVRRWCRDGHITAVQSPGGRGWRIPRSEIDRIQQGEEAAVG
jgi:excisionase family DNA binding protein